MPGTAQAGASRAFRFFDTITPTVGTTILADTVPCAGFGTGRLFCRSDAAGTLQVFQAPRAVGTATTVTFRQTDTMAVAAAGTSMPFTFNVLSDYVRVQFVPTAGDPAAFEASGHLLP